MEELVCWIFAGVLAAIVVVYFLFELHYFLRTALSVVLARLCKRKVHILDTTTVSGLCLMTDVDTLLLHMNNARYLREIDFARVDFYERTNLYRVIRAKGGSVFQGACSIRYRRLIRPFTVYRIVSKIIYWDNKSIFMEHRFVTPGDNFVRAIAICRQRVVNVNAEDVIKELLGHCRPPGLAESGVVSVHKPEPPLDLQRWIESIEISSASLRNGC